VHFSAAFPEKVGFFGGAKRQDVILPADEFALVLFADLTLDLHQLFAAAFDFAQWNFVSEVVSRGAVLVGVAEYTQPVEFRCFDEIAQFCEVGFCLARKADNE